MSEHSQLVLNGVASARVALPVKEKDCFGYAVRVGNEGAGCEYGDMVTAAYCEEDKESGCQYNGNHYGKPLEFEL